MSNIKELLQIPEEEKTDEQKQIIDLCVDKVVSLVLERKYHIPNMTLIFQENIMALCSEGAGFTLSESDDIRRAMGKKKAELMESYHSQFVDNWNERIGIFGEEVWNKMIGFAKYGFNKSHAVSYTLISLETANLQMRHLEDYMEYNYNTVDNKKKPTVLAMLLNNTTSSIKFPGLVNPFSGIKIGNLELKEIDKEILPVNFSCKTLPELFMADLNSTLKLKLILRGVYDGMSKDIDGLVKLNKKLGKKNTTGALLPLDNINSLEEMLEIFAMKDWMKVEVDNNVGFTQKVYKIYTKKRGSTVEDCLEIAKDFDGMGKAKKNYRVKSIIKEFGTYKDLGLSTYPKDKIDKYEMYVNRMNNVFTKIYENNPDMGKINIQMYKQIKNKCKKISEPLDNLIDDMGSENGILNCYVKDKKIRKDGSCILTLGFANNFMKSFYTKDNYFKLSIEKNDLIEVCVVPNPYIGRIDGMLKSATSVKYAGEY